MLTGFGMVKDAIEVVQQREFVQRDQPFWRPALGEHGQGGSQSQRSPESRRPASAGLHCKKDPDLIAYPIVRSAHQIIVTNKSPAPGNQAIFRNHRRSAPGSVSSRDNSERTKQLEGCTYAPDRRGQLFPLTLLPTRRPKRKPFFKAAHTSNTGHIRRKPDMVITCGKHPAESFQGG